jgi:hypothetical protein
LVLNPSDKSDLRTSAVISEGDRVFMRIFATNDSNAPKTFDHISAEIYANYESDVLVLAPSDCPHAGDIADIGDNVACSVSKRPARSGGLMADGDPSNGTQLDLVQTLIPGQQIGGFRLGTGKAGLISQGMPFVLQPGKTMHVADGRSRSTGMIAFFPGSTPVIALGFATIKGVPLIVTPAYATTTVMSRTPSP